MAVLLTIRSQEELELVSRVQRGLVADDVVNPYPDTVEYFTSKTEIMRTLPDASRHRQSLTIRSSQRRPRAQTAIRPLQARGQDGHEAGARHPGRQNPALQAP